MSGKIPSLMKYTKKTLETHHYVKSVRSIFTEGRLDDGNIRPLNLNLALEATIQYFPHKLVFCKVEFSDQVSFIP
jgi:hypothetical protein